MSSNWTTRFGTLKSVQTRKTKTGKPYITFEIQCKDFTQIGVCFDENLQSQFKNAEGQNIWTGGIMEERKLNTGKTVKSYKALKFKDKTLQNA